MDYALSSGGGNIAASGSPTTVETVQISNGVESCGNGNNGEPRGTTAYNNNCNAIDINTQAGVMNTGARAPPREPPLAARSAPCYDCVQLTSPPPPPSLPREMVLDGWGHRRRQPEQPTGARRRESPREGRLVVLRGLLEVRCARRPSQPAPPPAALAVRSARVHPGRRAREPPPSPPHHPHLLPHHVRR